MATSRLTARIPRVELLVALAALVPRVGYVLRCPGGYRGTFEYDPSVYFASSVALLHGRLPYADFVLVHPPGSTFALLPFALLAHLTTDHLGFAAAQLAFAGIGAVNAALVLRVARGCGYGAGAALTAGLFYALWPGATLAEYGSRLEPLGNLAVLLGLLAYLRAERTGGRLAALLGGAALGYAASVKIWWLLFVAVAVGWHLATPARRARVLPMLAGAAIVFVVVDLPFFLIAPSAMWHMVIGDQTGRPRALTNHYRVESVDGLGYMLKSIPAGSAYGIGVAFLIVVALFCLLAVRAPFGGLWVTLTVLSFAMLFAAPSYFAYYNDFVAPGLALVLAAAVSRYARPVAHGWRIPAAAGVAVVAVALAVLDVRGPRVMIERYPAAALRPAVAHARCAMSDSPMADIELNVLDRNLEHGCQDWIDVTGRSFPVLKTGSRYRGENLAWQRLLRSYLLSGQTVTIFRRTQTGIAEPLNRTIRSCELAAHRGPFRVYRVTSACRLRPVG